MTVCKGVSIVEKRRKVGGERMNCVCVCVGGKSSGRGNAHIVAETFLKSVNTKAFGKNALIMQTHTRSTCIHTGWRYD